MRRTIDDTALIEPFNSFHILLTAPFHSNMYSSDNYVYEPRFGDERHSNTPSQRLEFIWCIVIIDSSETQLRVHPSSSNGGSIKLSLTTEFLGVEFVPSVRRIWIPFVLHSCRLGFPLVHRVSPISPPLSTRQLRTHARKKKTRRGCCSCPPLSSWVRFSTFIQMKLSHKMHGVYWKAIFLTNCKIYLENV